MKSKTQVQVNQVREESLGVGTHQDLMEPLEPVEPLEPLEPS